MDDLDRLAADFESAGDELGAAVHKLVRVSTLQAEALGKAGANVRTGAMRASITSDFDGGPGDDVIRGETGPTVSYAHFPHDGTSRIAPNPFMDRAADVVEPQFHAGAAAIASTVGPGRG
ncbi:HK97-gp10 family putative phage morphogenesis protein [Micromonospora sp. NPDC048986]|uniref:HK97-gp10 family putative phage morphogenesis protein n=1 Tax=Micromonospora sp. NPDC048986 TaxID=3155644 RepID=UPI0033F15474